MDEKIFKLKILEGEDMSPTLEKGETINIKKVAVKEIKAGDIIVFKRYVLIAHRVICSLRFGAGFFLTKGDKCLNVDSPISYNNVLGQVVGKSIPKKTKKRNKILFSVLLSSYLICLPFLNKKVIRKMYKLHIKITSFLISN